jgi:GNAT superfamily N-acetyltransferase
VHLLSPRFGQTLAVETASGRLVALAHLLWDGEENEVAVVVEDTWQRRGIGAELLRKLVALATEAGRDSVYAVTQATNTGMVATMRTLGLPLDYQVEDGTLVITATVSSAGVAAPASGT